jgi:hypothetical protein
MLIGQYDENGWGGRTQAVIRPCWEEVESAVRALNRFTRPFVWFYNDEHADQGDEPDLEILGGEGAFAIQGLRAGKAFRFSDQARGDEPVAVWISDQGAEMPARYVCHDLNIVLRATKNFCERGELDPTLSWVAA